MPLTEAQCEARDIAELEKPDPDRIWLQPKCEGLAEHYGRGWCEDHPGDCTDADCGLKAVEYTRSAIAMKWEDATKAKIDPDSYYVVQHNGGEWRDFDLGVISGKLVEFRLKPEYVRGRPIWVAKIIRPD